MPFLPESLKKKLTTMPEPALRRLAYMTVSIDIAACIGLPVLAGVAFYVDANGQSSFWEIFRFVLFPSIICACPVLYGVSLLLSMKSRSRTFVELVAELSMSLYHFLAIEIFFVLYLLFK